MVFFGVCFGLFVACSDPADPCAEEIPGTLCQVIGTGSLGFNGDGLPPEETDLFLPTRARIGPDGRTYVLDFNNWLIRRIGDDGLVETFAGNGFHAPAFAGAGALESPLDNPTDFVFRADGSILVISFEDPRLLAITTDEVVRVLAGSDVQGVEGNEGDGGPALSARFQELEGIALGPAGEVYLTDRAAHRIRVIDEGIIRTFAGTGEEGYTGDGGPATDAQIYYPSAIEVADNGDVYFADTFNHVVRKIDSEGLIHTVAGTGLPGDGGDGQEALDTELDQPYGLSLDDQGGFYIADRENFKIRHVDEEGIIEIVAGSVEGFAGNGGPALDAKLGYVARMSFAKGQLLIADQSNGSIRRLVLPIVEQSEELVIVNPDSRLEPDTERYGE